MRSFAVACLLTAACGTSSKPEPADAGASCAWKLRDGEPTPLTEANGNALLTGVARDGAEVWVATTNHDEPSPDPAWRVRGVSTELAVGPSNTVLTRGAALVSFAGMTFDAAFDHRGGGAWDENAGCRFVALDAAGAAMGAPTSISLDWCFWATATPSGFSLFASSLQVGPITLWALDPNGHPIGSKANVLPAITGIDAPLARVRSDDGSLFVFWGDSHAVKAQRLSASGDSLQAPMVLFEKRSSPRFAAASLGASALVVLSADSARGDIVAATLAPTGELGAMIEVAHAEGPLTGLDVAASSKGALVAWSHGDGISLQPLDLDGKPAGSTLKAMAPPSPSDVHVQKIDDRAVIVYSATRAGEKTRAFADGLQCDP